jgi:serine/threonine protein kinase/WD40 repeat protein
MAPSSKHPSVIHDVRARLAGAADLSSTELVDLIARDLERHWQRGERVLVETYLAALPAPADADVRMDLIYSEILVREAAGDPPKPAEYVFRFPDLAERIQTQFLLHRTLLDQPADDEPEPVAAPQPPARTFAHAVPGYEILDELGSGGMGVVYRARHFELGRTVALKVLRADRLDREAGLRLRREAEALAKVQHPHIVQIYEVGLADGQPYLALEYVSGGTLADRFRAGAIAVRDVAAVVRMVALAVQAAHEQGLIHRDLKPANILLPPPVSPAPGTESASSTRSGVVPEPPVKVTDFGLVKRLDQDDLSRTGELLGTPSYMAPEQASGRKDVGPGADVYALGVILYEGLCGRPPFQAESAVSMLTQIAGGEPIPPSRLRRGISRDLEAVVLKCLEKAPGKRYASAVALAEDLRRFLAGEATQARPLTPAGRVVKLVRRHPLPAALLALVAVSLIGGLAGILWQWREAVAARGRLQTALRDEADQRRQAEHNLYRSRIAQAALLWEGGQVAQARDLLAACRPRGGEEDLRGWEWHYLNRLFHAEVNTLRLSRPVTGLALCPSLPDRPDELVVALGSSRLARREASGRAAVGEFLQPTGNLAELRPGPTVPGDAVAVAVQQPRSARGEKEQGGPLVAWAVTGRKLVVADHTTGLLLQTVDLPEEARSLCFTPEGTLLVGGGLHRVRELDAATGKKVADHILTVGTTDLLAIQPAGPLLAIGNMALARLVICERPTYRVVKELSSPLSGLQAIAFSPDGRRLAASYQAGVITVWEVGTWREVRRLQDVSVPVSALAFHPSGGQLATGGADRVVRLWDLTTGQIAATYRGHEAEVVGLAFGPRGDWLASASRDQTVRVWDTTRNPAGQLLRYHPSREGFGSDRLPHGLGVHSLNRDGTIQAWLTSGGRGLVRTEWSTQKRPGDPVHHSALLAGGRVAMIARADPRTVAIWDAEGTRPRLVLPPGAGAVQAVATDPTGRRLAWVAPAAEEGVTIRRWDATTETEGEPIRLNVPAVRSLTVASPGGWLAAVTNPGDAETDTAVWAVDLTGEHPPREVLRDALPVGGVAFRPDGRELAVTVGDTVHVYRVGDWELLQQFSCLAPAAALAYTPDGRRLAAVSEDGVVTLIDPATGKSLFQLHSLGKVRGKDVHPSLEVAFSADGAWLVSTNWDGSINLWDGSPVQAP